MKFLSYCVFHLLLITFTIIGYCTANYFPCLGVERVNFDMSQLNGTWYIYAYTVPDKEIDTMCDAYHINVNENGVFVNFTYVLKSTGEFRNYSATITSSNQNGSFLYNIQDEKPEDATIVYVLSLDSCNFINYGCETSYDHFGSLVIATKSRNTFEVNVDQLINTAVRAGAPKTDLQIVNQNNCIV